MREVVRADSTSRTAFAVRGAMIAFPVYVYGPTELLSSLQRRGPADSMPALGLNGGVGFIGFERVGGDTLRLRGAPYPMRMVFDAAKRAIEWARSGKGPYILEMLTYRYRGHSMSDPAKYRTKDEVTKYRQERDAIEQVRKRLLDGGAMSEDDLKKIETEIRAIVTEAADFATNNPEPGPSELWTDITIEA